eukprot:628611_1
MSKKDKASKKPRMSINKRSGLTIPVQRVKRDLTSNSANSWSRISVTAPIYLAAVLEYTVAEVLELSGNCAKDYKKRTIAPRHIMLGIKTDDELNTLCQDVIFPGTGTLSRIEPVLLKKKHKKYSKKTQPQTSSQSV